MKLRISKIVAVSALVLAIAACKTQAPSSAGTNAPPAGDTAAPAAGTSGGGTTTAGTAGTGTTAGAATGTSIPSLVNVNLQNVLNNLSVALHVDRANIPVNAQVPVDVAANVCGVSVNVLAASVASGKGSCTATTTSPTLIQSVQQQLSAGGGTQTGSTAPAQ